MSLEWLYTFSELSIVDVDSEKGRERLDAQIKNLPAALKLTGVKLPKKPKILCLMAGSCIEGIALAQHFKVEVTCLDLQKRLLDKGAKEAKKRHLKIRTVQGDVTKLDTRAGRGYHLITLIGSPLAHLNINQFDQVLLKIRNILDKQGNLLIDQADNIFRILPTYRDAFLANREPPVINIHVSFNPQEGYFERLYLGEGKHATYKMHFWSPWIIEYMLKKNKLRNVQVIPYTDPYSKAQTTLFTATL